MCSTYRTDCLLKTFLNFHTDGSRHKHNRKLLRLARTLISRKSCLIDLFPIKLRILIFFLFFTVNFHKSTRKTNSFLMIESYLELWFTFQEELERTFKRIVFQIAALAKRKPLKFTIPDGKSYTKHMLFYRKELIQIKLKGIFHSRMASSCMVGAIYRRHILLSTTRFQGATESEGIKM